MMKVKKGDLFNRTYGRAVLVNNFLLRYTLWFKLYEKTKKMLVMFGSNNLLWR